MGDTGFTLSVCASVYLSICRWHGFRSVIQVCFAISISNFICILFVAVGRSLSIFSDITFKMAVWHLYWILWFPDSNLSLALYSKSKLQWYITCVYGKKTVDFQQCHWQNSCLVAILDFSTQVCFGNSIPEVCIFSALSFSKLPPCSHIRLLIFQTLTSVCLYIWSPKCHITCVYGKEPIGFQ